MAISKILPVVAAIALAAASAAEAQSLPNPNWCVEQVEAYNRGESDSNYDSEEFWYPVYVFRNTCNNPVLLHLRVTHYHDGQIVCYPMTAQIEGGERGYMYGTKMQRGESSFNHKCVDYTNKANQNRSGVAYCAQNGQPRCPAFYPSN